jgi:ribosomal protein L37AE/L43A
MNLELQKELMWIQITSTNQCPKCKRDLGNKQEDLSLIAIIITCEKCHKKFFYSIIKFFGAFFILEHTSIYE